MSAAVFPQMPFDTRDITENASQERHRQPELRGPSVGPDELCRIRDRVEGALMGSETPDRRVGIEHIHLRDTDPRDHRLLRITPCGDGMVGLAIVERTENLPTTETEIAGVIVDGAPLWNALFAMYVSEAVDRG